MVVQYAGITLMATLLKETVSLSTRAVEHLLVQDMAETKYFWTRHIQIFVAHVILYVCVSDLRCVSVDIPLLIEKKLKIDINTIR